jgi:hypothetical protein
MRSIVHLNVIMRRTTVPHSEAELNSYMHTLFDVALNNTIYLENCGILATKHSMDVSYLWIQVVFFAILFNSYEGRKNALFVLFCYTDLTFWQPSFTFKF